MVIALVVILVTALWKMYPPAQHLDAWIASTFAVTLAVTVLGAVLCYITNDIDLDGDEDMVDFARQFFDIDGDGKTSSFEASLALFLVSAALAGITAGGEAAGGEALRQRRLETAIAAEVERRAAEVERRLQAWKVQMYAIANLDTIPITRINQKREELRRAVVREFQSQGRQNP